MSQTYNTKAIVLKRDSFREADNFLTLYTQNLGKIRVRVKAAKKPYSKLSGHTEPFCQTNFMLAKSRTVDIVCNAQTLKSFSCLKKDLTKISAAYYVCEIVDLLTKEALSNEKIYNLLESTLGLIESASSALEVKLIIRYFEFRLLAVLGFKPAIDHCPTCQNEDRKEAFFSSQEGGLLCKNCLPRDPLALKITENIVDILRSFQNREVLGRKVSNKELHQLEIILGSYINHYAEKEVKSRGFLKQIEICEATNSY